MEFKYVITNRFLLSEGYEFRSLFPAFFSEIVTLDANLCKQKYIDPTSGEYIWNMDDYQKTLNFPLAKNEQLIKYVEVKTREFFKDESEFVFCGFDIMDYFEDNSWLTGYCIPYENQSQKYTKFGLLVSFEDSLEWVDAHAQESRELENKEYKVFAVWRKINSNYGNK